MCSTSRISTNLSTIKDVVNNNCSTSTTLNPSSKRDIHGIPSTELNNNNNINNNHT
eukprot:UN09994